MAFVIHIPDERVFCIVFVMKYRFSLMETSLFSLVRKIAAFGRCIVKETHITNGNQKFPLSCCFLARPRLEIIAG